MQNELSVRKTEDGHANGNRDETPLPPKLMLDAEEVPVVLNEAGGTAHLTSLRVAREIGDQRRRASPARSPSLRNLNPNCTAQD